MARSNHTRTKVEAPPDYKTPVVRAIFDPAGDIHVRAVTPGGTEYQVAPRVPFEIADEDVDWFFHEWNWEHRQRLCREEDYQPRRPQFDNGVASQEAKVEEPERAQFDNNRVVEDRPDRAQFNNGQAPPTQTVPEPEETEETEKTEETEEPDPVVAAAEDGEPDEAKE